MKTRWLAHARLIPIVAALMLTAVPAVDAKDAALEARIKAIMARPEFKDAKWAMQFQLVDGEQPIYALNRDTLMTAASSFKVFVEGNAFSRLGPDYRFRTPVYRTGPIVDGVLKGDLVIVASGDLLLGGRIGADGSLALPEPDHTYADIPGAGPVPGDPLQVLRALAKDIASQGIRRVEGRVLVDASLFRPGKARVGMGNEMTVSPMMINDNVVDITVRPGMTVGAPAVVQVSPQTGYLRIVNETKTVAAGNQRPKRIGFASDVANADGTHTLTVAGEIALQGAKEFRVYHIPELDRFAAIAFVEALADAGVSAKWTASDIDAAALAVHYIGQNLVAEHVSLPLSEQVKVMLKVSSNIHTAAFPYIVGAIAGKDGNNAREAGERLRGELFASMGLDSKAGAQNLYTPEFFITFLSHMAQQPWFGEYHRALPIMGRDGSLQHVQVDSPAAGHVFAKTGTGMGMRGPSSGPAKLNKALAGYIKLPDGRLVAFAEFAEVAVPSPDAREDTAGKAGEALGEIVTAVYESMARGGSHSGES
jgi:D-alanyl-D-alanine carboxypeptidase/D-alanyl-D-alanine-endopeptidase (penicillin-binding protein 4)